MVLKSRDLHGIYGFLCLKYQPYNSVSFKYLSFIYWYEAIGAKNLFKQPKRVLELKLSNFKNFVNCKLSSVCLTTTIDLSQPKLLHCKTEKLYLLDAVELIPLTWDYCQLV